MWKCFYVLPFSIFIFDWVWPWSFRFLCSTYRGAIECVDFPYSLWIFQVVYRLVQNNWIHLTVWTPHVLTLLELWGQVVLHTRVIASVYYWKLWTFWRPPWNHKANFLDTALQIKPFLQLVFLHRCRFMHLNFSKCEHVCYVVLILFKCWERLVILAATAAVYDHRLESWSFDSSKQSTHSRDSLEHRADQTNHILMKGKLLPLHNVTDVAFCPDYHEHTHTIQHWLFYK